jgi:hypothetical protein
MRRQFSILGLVIVGLVLGLLPSPLVFVGLPVLLVAVVLGRDSTRLWKLLAFAAFAWAVTLHGYGGLDFDCLTWWGRQVCKVRNEGDSGPTWLGNPAAHDVLFWSHMASTLSVFISAGSLLIVRFRRLPLRTGTP